MPNARTQSFSLWLGAKMQTESDSLSPCGSPPTPMSWYNGEVGLVSLLPDQDLLRLVCKASLDLRKVVIRHL